MKNFSVFIIFLNIFVSQCDFNSEEVDYYEKLINEGIRNSFVYQPPQNASEYKPTNSVPIDFGTYDFIVVEGGSAGAVVASRLSEIKQWKVLLLEAGKDGNNFTNIPSMSVYSLSSDYNWGFETAPQNTCCLASRGICPFPRGKGLGGTSIINALIYVRGNPLDYDKWEELGNPGWAYKDVLPYFIKSENSNIDGDPGYHGYGGYLNVEYHIPASKKVDIFLEANKQQGRSILDYNGKEQIGASRNQFNEIHGRRLSSSNAFLDPVRNRTNLHILTESYVTRILFSNTTMKADAVLFSHKNLEYLVQVNKEIIISGGIVGSAQVLLQSGVGPKADLEKLGIPLVKNLAVGENLHDHLTFYHNYFLTYQHEPSFDMRNAIKQFLNGTGPLTVSTNSQGISFYRLGLTDYGVPDIEIIIVPSVQTGGFGTTNRGAIYGHADKTWWGKSIVGNHVFQIVVVLLHPKTRGRIYLKSNNPYNYPMINSRCLDDPNDEDIEGVYQGIQVALKLVNTKAFRELKPVLVPYPDCLHKVFLSKGYWKCLIRQTAMNAYHGGGTCQMGPDPAKGAVVNNRLQVHGIPNVRVADTSIAPITLSAHMNAPAMMIGERAANFIKEDHSALYK